MRRLRLASSSFFVLVAISGCDSSRECRSSCCDVLREEGVAFTCIDAPGPQPDAYRPGCDLLASSPNLSGCFPFDSTKCGWVLEHPDDPNDRDRIECIALEGDEVGLGEACMLREPFNIFDNCARGLHCHEGSCRQICDLDGIGCGAGFSCFAVPDLFFENNTTFAGVCL